MQRFLPPSIMYITYAGIDRKNKWMRIVGAYMLYANLVTGFFLFFCKTYFVRRIFSFNLLECLTIIFNYSFLFYVDI